MLTQVPVLALVGSGALDLPAHAVAAGRTADVYEVDDRTVVKLYHPGYRRADVEHEVRVAQDAHGRAIPTPAPLGIVEHGGRFGIIFERVTGESMLEHLVRRPWSAPQLARSLADLQAAVHERRLPPEFRRYSTGCGLGSKAQMSSPAT
jgi:Ser/Thr protein kinase RdoA (MazF antagonist)